MSIPTLKGRFPAEFSLGMLVRLLFIHHLSSTLCTVVYEIAIIICTNSSPQKDASTVGAT
jgi:hypothetical protein